MERALSSINDDLQFIKEHIVTVEDDQTAAQADLDAIIAKVDGDFTSLEDRIAALDAANPDPAAVAALQAATVATRASIANLTAVDTTANPAAPVLPVTAGGTPVTPGTPVTIVGGPNASANPADNVIPTSPANTPAGANPTDTRDTPHPA